METFRVKLKENFGPVELISWREKNKQTESKFTVIFTWLTDKMKWQNTWNATKATRIQSNQSGSSAFVNFTAKNIVTTKKTINEKFIRSYSECTFAYMHKCVLHFRQANEANWKSVFCLTSVLDETVHQTVAKNKLPLLSCRESRADYLLTTRRQVRWKSKRMQQLWAPTWWSWRIDATTSKCQTIISDLRSNIWAHFTYRKPLIFATQLTADPRLLEVTRKKNANRCCANPRGQHECRVQSQK